MPMSDVIIYKNIFIVLNNLNFKCVKETENVKNYPLLQSVDSRLSDDMT